MERLDCFEWTRSVPALASDEIHLWFCEFGELNQHPRAGRQDAQGYLRAVLQGYIGSSVADDDFEIGQHGRPRLPRRPQLGFNLSHTRQAAMVAVAMDLSPGVDIEIGNRKRPVLDLARRYFCPRETAVLERLAPEQAQDAFLAIWTAKEAVLKAIGRGLAFGLDRLEFSLDADGQPVRLESIAEEGGNVATWQCMTLRPAEGFHGCLAWAGSTRRVRTFRVAATRIDGALRW
ncbi:MAG: 4'-phosphopantetheinyl transferase superfamily protein [Tahibacter sp.]